jgi:hypothetical protein
MTTWSRLKRSTRRVAALGAVTYAAIFLSGCGNASSAGIQSRDTRGGQSGTVPAIAAKAAAAPAAGTLPAGIPAGARIERTAGVAMEVKSDAFDETIDRVFGLMRDLNGYVSGSDMSGDSTGLRSGTLSFKVPPIASRRPSHGCGSSEQRRR